MKKLGLILGGFVMAFGLLFSVPGNAVLADDNCECHDVSPINGAEKNKLVADLLKSNEFKNAKKELMASGYAYHGISDAEVMWQNAWEIVIIGVPFYAENGDVVMATFFDGKYMGYAPEE